MTLHLRCIACDFLDVVLRENGRDWKCPSCEFIKSQKMSEYNDKNAVIGALRDLIRCYDQSQGPNPLSQEVSIWRERFLDSRPELSDRCRGYFLYLPCDGVVKKGVEASLDECLEMCKN